MPDGIVILDEETVGYWTNLDRTGISIDFEDVKQRDNFLELASEHGVTLSFLESPPDTEE